VNAPSSNVAASKETPLSIIPENINEIKKVETNVEAGFNNKAIVSVITKIDRTVSRVDKAVNKVEKVPKKRIKFHEYFKGIAHFYSTPMVLFVNNAVSHFNLINF
jgi:hypothetical protein